ncbi:MAG: 2-hydroxychromene-2-carboxylate isomerase [Rhodoblastus sp.]|nr:2-hydroxychromene-2-carboxylate isomerase [Rhodoblastus sp.]
MSRTIAYYFTLVSPWAYIGHDLVTTIARKHDATLDYRPVNLGEVFPNSGGLPLAKRHPLRVAYRTVELKRWREKRGLDFALKPRGWPFDPTLADCVAVAMLARGEDPNVYLANAFRAVFEKERNLGEAANIASLLNEAGHNADVLIADAQSQPIREAYAANNKAALETGVFGSPSYVLNGEVFWGQDRIELLDDALASGRKPFLAD